MATCWTTDEAFGMWWGHCRSDVDHHLSCPLMFNPQTSRCRLSPHPPVPSSKNKGRQRGIRPYECAWTYSCLWPPPPPPHPPPAPLSQPGDCAEYTGGRKSACASRTEKVHRSEVQDVPLRRRRRREKNPPEDQKYHGLTRWKDRARHLSHRRYTSPGKMGFPTIYGCRRVVLKLFLLQFIVFQATYAAPSPIIKFPGDDTTPTTDKEVALVSLLLVFPETLSKWVSHVWMHSFYV